MFTTKLGPVWNLETDAPDNPSEWKNSNMAKSSRNKTAQEWLSKHNRSQEPNLCALLLMTYRAFFRVQASTA